jgi:hypothetical protein
MFNMQTKFSKLYNNKFDQPNYSWHVKFNSLFKINMNLILKFKNIFASPKVFYIKNITIKLVPFLIPLFVALYLYNPFDNTFSFYWDQTILLQDKSIFTSSFYFFQERFGFGVYGYYLNYIVYSIFSYIFGPEKGIDIMMIALVQTAFWGAFLFLKEVTRSVSNLNIYLLALIYIVSIETQMNVYRTILGQNFLWGFLPLACYFTLKVIKEKSFKWQLALASTLFFLQVSFAHPTSILNYAFIVGLTMLLSLIYTKFNLAKFIRIVVINIIVFLPILLQIILINREVSGYIYNSSNAFAGDFILSWYELGKARFELRNILRLDYFLESQIRTDSYNQESLLRLANTKISNVFSIYSWFNIINLGFFVIIFLPILQFSKSEFLVFLKKIKVWLLSKLKPFKLRNKAEKNLPSKNNNLEKNEIKLETNKVKVYVVSVLSAMFAVSVMGMFQGPLLQFFGLVYKIVPSVFLLYRYLDAKFGIVFIFIILLAVASTYSLIKSDKLKFGINIFLIIINIIYFGFFSTKYFISPYGQVELPAEYSSACSFLKNNAFRTMKFPYSYDFLHFTNLSNNQVLSNDVFNQNCNQSVLAIRTLPTQDEIEIIKTYDLMVTNPEKFKQKIQELSIDTIMVDKQFIPNYSWYRISSEEEKDLLIKKIDSNYSQNKVYENNYLAIYKFSSVQPFYISNGNLEYSKINPTHYNLTINNITSNSTLEFQYSYGNWSITKPNTKYLLPDSMFNHYKGRGFNNSWSINFSSLQQNCVSSYCQKNEDESYNLNLELWYKPQVVFEEFMLVYLLSLLAIFSYQLKYKYYDQTK